MRTLAALLSLGVLASCSHQAESGVLSGVVEARLANIASRVGGRVIEVLVDEGQTVEAGQVIVRLEAKELVAERDQLEARKAQAEAALARLENGSRPQEVAQAGANAAREQATLEALRNGPRPEEIRQAEADLASARADAANAQSVADRIEKLQATGDVSKQQWDDARTRRDAMAEKVKAADQRVALLHAGTRKEDIAAAEARVAQARANADLVRTGARKEDIAQARAAVAEIDALIKTNADKLGELEIRSPSKARLDTVSVRPGDVVAANRVVASLLEPSQIWVRAYVPEPRMGSVKVGQPASLRIDTFSDHNFRGEVAQIATQSEFLPRNVQTREDRDYQVFAIRIRPTEGLDVLKPGMSVAVTLE